MLSIVYFFPELNLKKINFEQAGNYARFSLFTHPFSNSSLVAHWKDAENRKKALMKYASVHSFDPLIAANWYQVSHNDLNSYSVSYVLY